ncbi:MAG: hypothetical protein AB8B53_15030 [Flavobacteriales bacterium]
MSLTLVLIAFFHYTGFVNWKTVGVITIDQQTMGGSLTARFVRKPKKTNEVAYYVLIVIMVLAIVRLFFW